MRHHFSTNEVDVFYHSRTARLLLIVFTSLLPAILYGPARAAEPHLEAGESPMKVEGKIVDIQADFIVVKTSLAELPVEQENGSVECGSGRYGDPVGDLRACGDRSPSTRHRPAASFHYGDVT